MREVSPQEKLRIIDEAYVGRIYTKAAWREYLDKRKASFHGAIFFKGCRIEIFDTLDGDVFMARWTSEKETAVEVFPSMGGRLISSVLIC